MAIILPPAFNLPYHPVDDPTLTFTGRLYLPDEGLWGSGPYPMVICTRAGGFTLGGPAESNDMLTDLAASGYLAMFFDVRLAKSARKTGGLNGQVSMGYWKQQTDDCFQAMLYARSHPLCNGWVAHAGGSGSGHHSAYTATWGTNGTTRPDASIVLSGMLDGGDTESDVGNSVKSKIHLYFQTSDSTTLTSRSPIAGINTDTCPIYFANGTAEPMPKTMFDRFKAALDDVPLTNYVSHVNTASGGILHSFGTYPENKDAIKSFLSETAGVYGP